MGLERSNERSPVAFFFYSIVNTLLCADIVLVSQPAAEDKSQQACAPSGMIAPEPKS
jgi:hypothetical protein